MEPYCGTIREPGLPVVDLFVGGKFKVSVNENFSTLLDFVFFYFGHEWVLYFILAEKENQKVLFNPSKMSLF